jgi:hypothetical protein
MAHDVFISYASPDKKAADAVCASLEQKGIRCCIFPRDGIPGKSFAETITEFMASCRVVVLMLSSHANLSKHISREVEMAVRRGLTVIPFRIENVQPSGSLEYWIAEAHWLDAITPEMERGLEKLAEWVLPHVSVVKRPVEPEAGPARDLRELYRAALNVAWADGRLDEAEMRTLEDIATRYQLTRNDREVVEREVLGDTLAAVATRTRQRAAASGAGPESDKATRPIFCRKCGARAQPTARFCRQCGTQVPV